MNGRFTMHAIKRVAMTIWVISMLMMPFASIPLVSSYTPGDEAEMFGHTFAEEYWTNDSITVEDENDNVATFTASYVGKDNFSAFLIAFNKLVANDSKEYILPYQLFGMHFLTPDDQEVFIGAIFAFLMVHNESYGGNNLPDVGNEKAWYILPISSLNPWNDVTPAVEPIPATKIEENHYRFGMRYTNISARVVDATSPGGFFASLLLPLVTVLFSEIVIQYDITIDPSTGQVHAETLYTIGQVTRARLFLDIFEVDPREIINETMAITAVHYLSIFTSNYKVTSAGTGNTIQAPTATTPINENISIKVGDDDERAFDIGLGRTYSLINESTNPWTTMSDNETALNALLGARAGDFLLVAWQAPLSAFLFAHAAYALSEQIRSTYANVGQLVQNAGTAFHNSQWWYGVSFSEWNGLRVQQDPVYVAYTNIEEPPTTTTTGTDLTPPDSDGAGGLALLAIIAVGILCLVVVMKRR